MSEIVSLKSSHFTLSEKKYARGELLRASRIMGRPLASQTSALRGQKPRVSILLPKTSQIILDKVLVLDKGTASVNAPPPLHRKITISYRLSVTHTAMKKKLSGYQLSAISHALAINFCFDYRPFYRLGTNTGAHPQAAPERGHWKHPRTCRLRLLGK